ARITPTNVFIAFGFFFGIFFVLPQFGQLGQIITRIDNINVVWFFLALIASAGTYVAAAFTLMAAAQGIQMRVPLYLTSIAELAGSFANRFTPFGIGGFALTSRYLQCFGSSKAQSIASVALPVVAGTITTTILMAIVAPSAVGDLLKGITIDSKAKLVVALTGSLLAVGTLIFMVFSRKTSQFIQSALNSAIISGRQLAQSGRVIRLLLGSILITSTYVLALFASVKAFSLDLSIIQAFVVYVAGSTIGQATPTPGGLGGKEVAYAAGLIAFGITASGAIAAVLLFRLLTFWLPMIPGAIAFRYLKHSAYF
ncbi:flippase-like domain-containing protein, partial [Candidatus Saccharibacteria bacterium]|nr:flippase-like domain-containing protein [Candidatus Saccharibacteria bacterium]